MKERPVIFNGEMVRAIIDGRKTQTRRAISDRHLHLIDVASQVGECYPLESGIDHANSQSYYREHCPFGQVGDRLWVRETFAVLGNEDGCPIDWDGNLIKGNEKHAARIYKASCWQEPGNYGLWSIPNRDTQYEGAWRPSIHMPRWASRITLEITAVRVERLNDISDGDAIREGCSAADMKSGDCVADVFARLWASIYGEESWRANPWVWVIEFRRVEVEK
ncbi:hypothetical protein OHN11_09760 [Serratia marcescens]|uniref:hypothetical protein n=1 Tax=Serratia marcescens TaxID=615 RepID=UPI000420958D|nr:hypothetical protein [Serratia marcescens]EIJ7464299.1 hypothetical protein [Serratia marcescens]EJA2551636.1 hypothetical protein [Serratia marcescens]EJA2596544.1 hypothetical protein [Serratia marcescens]EME9756260.1 hypothetical protein [Serratia marcescens]MDM3533596.1 hypothetical protein [Serratia marcescens]